MTRMNECQCEHKDHFDGVNALDHPYGVAKFPDFETAVVMTTFGRFILCENCRGSLHMAPYKGVKPLAERKV